MEKEEINEQQLPNQAPNKTNLSVITGISISKINDFSTTSNGKEIKGHEFIHPGDRMPAIIISHEFGNNQLSSARYVADQYNMGYNVYIFDFAGGGLLSTSDGDSTDMSVLTEENDLNSVINYVRDLNYTDTNKIILEGNSQGGFVSALIAAKRPDDISKLILNYPANMIPDTIRAGDFLGNKIDSKNPPQSLTMFGIFTLSRKYFTDAQTITDAYELIGKYRKPVLMTYGTADNMVPQSSFKNTEQAYSDIKAVAIKNGTHGYMTDPENLAIAQQVITKFLK